MNGYKWNSVVGHVDNLGYLRCVQCHEDSERASIQAVVADNAAYYGERCDRCRQLVIPHAPAWWLAGVPGEASS